MKERLVTLALAVGALFLVYALFLPKPPPENIQSLPVSADSGFAGYQAAWRWLNEVNIPAVSLRNRFDRLAADQSLPRAGNVLITTMPHKLPVRPEEATRLDAWIERGNTLVIAAALDDTPAWALQDPTRFVRDVGRLARLKVETVDDKDDGAAPAPTLKATLEALSVPRVLAIEPRGAHPLMSGVRLLKVDSDLPASRWTATPMDTSGVLQVAQAVEGGNPAIWIRPQVSGQVILLGAAGLFSNRDLATADNAKLLSNIIGWTLQKGGSVIFDDAHQGAVDYYDAKAFYKDPRLHHTLWWLVLLWLVFVLGVQRFRGHASRKEPADVTALVNSSGEFFASVLRPPTAGARLLQNFFNGIHRRLGSREDGTPVWDWLTAQAAVSRDDVNELRQLDAKIRSGRRFSLPRLQNLLSELQGKIA